MDLPAGYYLKFRYNNGSGIITKYLDIGKAVSHGNTYSPSNTSASIPVQPAQNRFVMNTGVTRSISLDFTRVQPNPDSIRDDLLPDDDDDPSTWSRAWSNGFWTYIIKRFLINRWQGETDGCKLVYVSPDEDLYPSIGEKNCYISEFSPRQSIGMTHAISGTLKVTIGATNISKVSAEHTIIYQSNYGGNAQIQHKQFVGTESNMVKVTDDSEVLSLDIPATWLTIAQENGLITNITSAKANSVWSLSPQGEGVSYQQNTSIKLNTPTITLYAIYQETS